MFDVFKWLLPPDREVPEKLWPYLRRLALTMLVSFFTLFFIVIPAMFYALPRLGSLAWAGDIDTKIEAAIAAKLEPVNANLDALSKRQREQGTILSELAVASLRTDICRYVSRRILERDQGERARLLNQIEDMKSKYRQYADREFNTGDC